MLMLYLPAPMQGPARAESSRSTERALALDPELGQVYGTLANLVPRFNNWSEVEALFQKGLAKTPSNPNLMHLHAQFLLSAGRTADGIARLRVLRARNPLSAAIAVDLATALFDAGRAAEALAAIDQAYALWPAIMLVWSECVRLHVVADQFDRVQSLLDAPPPGIAPDDPNLARRRLHLIARRDRRPADLAAGRKNFMEFSRVGIAPATVAIHALTTLDQPDAAFEIAQEIFRSDPPQARSAGVNMMGTYTLAGQPDAVVLFRRDTANLRRLAGFGEILNRIGLEDYWRQSKSVPDFRAG
jgi:tetratricopeptide (TPR) repeat protein